MRYKLSTKENWDNVWQKHDTKESYNYFDSRMERARDKISTFIDQGITFENDEHVLEAGCGDGSIIFELLSHFNIKCVGIDFSEVAQKSTLKRMANCNKIFQYNLGDVHKLPYKDNSFDKVISLGVIEHFHDNQVIMKEMHHVLKPNGVVILMTPNRNSFGRIDRLFKETLKKWKFGYQTEYTTQQLKSLSQKTGFSIVKSFVSLRRSKPNDSISFKIISRVDQFFNIFFKNVGFYSYVLITKIEEK
ncbi:class I SAM-dependent methyltransferase [Leuconostoc palmae]|uniref:class I SAM-dependent methyltransferase n=1 Tax=Leuconostoc palmae TaxID=501487 RepID=UPI001C7D9466|nr:class I SAM-dependent methyltransferase [Leuconostoc palmae]